MTDEIHKLLAVCLLDGRNSDKLALLKEYFSEYALIRYRLRVETEYLLFLNRETSLFKKLTAIEENKIKLIYRRFTPKEALKVKETEKIINHDVKAVEYYLGDSLKKSGLGMIIPFVHFGLTSYDTNIPAYGMILRDFKNQKFRYAGQDSRTTGLADNHGQGIGGFLSTIDKRNENNGKDKNRRQIERSCG